MKKRMFIRMYVCIIDCYDWFSFNILSDEKHLFQTITAVIIALIDFRGETFVKFCIWHLLFSFHRRNKCVIRPLTNIHWTLRFGIAFHNTLATNEKSRFVIFSLLYGSAMSIRARVAINCYHKVRSLLAQDRKKHRNKDVGRSILNLSVYKNVIFTCRGI